MWCWRLWIHHSFMFVLHFPMRGTLRKPRMHWLGDAEPNKGYTVRSLHKTARWRSKKQEATGSYFIHTTGSGPVLFWLSLLMNEWMHAFCDAIATTEERQPLQLRQHVVRTGGLPVFRHSCHAYPLSTSALCGLHWKNNKDETPVFLLCLPK